MVAVDIRIFTDRYIRGLLSSGVTLTSVLVAEVGPKKKKGGGLGFTVVSIPQTKNGYPSPWGIGGIGGLGEEFLLIRTLKMSNPERARRTRPMSGSNASFCTVSKPPILPPPGVKTSRKMSSICPRKKTSPRPPS